MKREGVRTETRDGVMTITLDRPERGNALLPNMMAMFRELWSEGQRPTADELLKELTSAEIELEAVAEYVRDALAAA